LPAFGGQSGGIGQRYEALDAQMTAIGMPLEDEPPVITNFPIWLSVSTGAKALALPAESPADVLNLASHFGTRLLIIHGDDHAGWPSVLETGVPGADCFDEIDLGVPADPRFARALDDTRVYRLICP
jgi:hypothetical protein